MYMYMYEYMYSRTMYKYIIKSTFCFRSYTCTTERSVPNIQKPFCFKTELEWTVFARGVCGLLYSMQPDT